jgi:hypothetical protein
MPLAREMLFQYAMKISDVGQVGSRPRAENWLSAWASNWEKRGATIAV